MVSTSQEVCAEGKLPMKTYSTGLLICVFFLALSRPSIAGGFGPVTVYPADMNPVFANAGDFNHDGIVDLVVVNSLSNDVSVLLGNAGGGYQPAVNYAVGAAPASMAIEDFNGDGNLDLAVTNSGSNNISILLGNSDGTFQPAVQYSVGTGVGPSGILWSIFTGSGHIDLAVVNTSGGTNNKGNVAVFLGNGDGTFQTARNYDTLGSAPSSLASSDFNGDGNPDLALANSSSNSVSILFGDGKGGFIGSGDYPAGSGPTSVTIWGLSSSLAVTNPSSNGITVLDNTGGGVFNHSKAYAIGAMPVYIGAGFFNQGSLQALVTADSNNTVSVLLGRRGKPPLRKPVSFATCTSPKSAVGADVNLDGKEDLVVACSNGVGVMLNTGP